MARILVAEGDEPARRFLERALQLGDHDVTAVGSGPEAIDELGRRPYEVLITDHRLPQASGVAVIGAAQLLEPGICCLILAGPTDADATIEAMEAGAVGVIPKPARVKQVLLHVACAAERHELARQARRARIMDSILERAGLPLLDVDRDAVPSRPPWWVSSDRPESLRSRDHAEHHRTPREH